MLSTATLKARSAKPVLYPQRLQWKEQYANVALSIQWGEVTVKGHIDSAKRGSQGPKGDGPREGTCIYQPFIAHYVDMS